MPPLPRYLILSAFDNLYLILSAFHAVVRCVQSHARRVGNHFARHGHLITTTTGMWLLTLPLQRLSSRSSVNPRMLFGAQQPVQLEQLTLGLGSVVADGVHMPCQVRLPSPTMHAVRRACLRVAAPTLNPPPPPSTAALLRRPPPPPSTAARSTRRSRCRARCRLPHWCLRTLWRWLSMELKPYPKPNPSRSASPNSNPNPSPSPNLALTPTLTLWRRPGPC